MLGPSLPRRQSLPSGPLHARLAADLLALHPHPCSLPQAANLIKAGYDVTVWNRSADKCAALQAAGAKVHLGSGARHLHFAARHPQLGGCCSLSRASQTAAAADGRHCIHVHAALLPGAGGWQPCRGGVRLRHHAGHAVRPRGLPRRGQGCACALGSRWNMLGIVSRAACCPEQTSSLAHRKCSDQSGCRGFLHHLLLPAGPDGVASAMKAGKGYVDVSTVDAATAQEVS